jgi:hypothetical protein
VNAWTESQQATYAKRQEMAQTDDATRHPECGKREQAAPPLARVGRLLGWSAPMPHNVGPINGRSRAPAALELQKLYLRLRSVALAGYPAFSDTGKSA